MPNPGLVGLLCAALCEEDSVEKALLKHAARGNLRRLMATLDRPDCPSVNNLFDDNRRTALHLAALGGHKECLKELLRRRANPNMCVQIYTLLDMLLVRE